MSGSVRSLIASEKGSGTWSFSSPSPRRAEREISIRLPRLPFNGPDGTSLSKEHSEGAPELQPPPASLSFLDEIPCESPASRSMENTLWPSMEPISDSVSSAAEWGVAVAGGTGVCIGVDARGTLDEHSSSGGSESPIVNEDEVWTWDCQGFTRRRCGMRSTFWGAVMTLE